MNDSSEYLTSVKVTPFRSRTSQPSAYPSARNSDWLTILLNSYFNRLERGEKTGYPTQNVLSIDWQRGDIGHRILIHGMNSRDIKTGKAIRALNVHHQLAIHARYGLHRNAKGRLLTNTEKAWAIGIPLRTFEARVRAARKRLVSLIGKE